MWIVFHKTRKCMDNDGYCLVHQSWYAANITYIGTTLQSKNCHCLQDKLVDTLPFVCMYIYIYIYIFQKDHLVASLDDLMSRYTPPVESHRYKIRFVPAVDSDASPEDIHGQVNYDSRLVSNIPATLYNYTCVLFLFHKSTRNIHYFYLSGCHRVVLMHSLIVYNNIKKNLKNPK